jgi:hypothetical protein
MAKPKKPARQPAGRKKRVDIKTESVRAKSRGVSGLKAQNKDAKKLAEGREKVATDRKNRSTSVRTTDRLAATTTSRPGAKKRRMAPKPGPTPVIDEKKVARTRKRAEAKAPGVRKAKLVDGKPFGEQVAERESDETRRAHGDAKLRLTRLEERPEDHAVVHQQLVNTANSKGFDFTTKSTIPEIDAAVEARRQSIERKPKIEYAHNDDGRIVKKYTRRKLREAFGSHVNDIEVAEPKPSTVLYDINNLKNHIKITPQEYSANRAAEIAAAKKEVERTGRARKKASDIPGNAKRVETESKVTDEVNARQEKQRKREAAALERTPETKILRFSEADITDHLGRRVPRWQYLKFNSAQHMASSRRPGESHTNFIRRNGAAIQEKMTRLGSRKRPSRGSAVEIIGVGGSRRLRDASNNPIKIARKPVGERLARKISSHTGPSKDVKSKQISDAIADLSKTENPFK